MRYKIINLMEWESPNAEYFKRLRHTSMWLAKW